VSEQRKRAPKKQRSKNNPPPDLSGNDPNHVMGKRNGATITADGSFGFGIHSKTYPDSIIYGEGGRSVVTRDHVTRWRYALGPCSCAAQPKEGVE